MKVYFAGSIRGGRDDQELYNSLISEIGRHATVLTEHIGSKNISKAGEINRTDEYIYKRDMEWIREADMIIAEVSTPSLGVGYKLGYAESIHKPIFALFRPQEGRKLSAMIAGNSYVQTYEYKDLETVQKILKKIFNK